MRYHLYSWLIAIMIGLSGWIIHRFFSDEVLVLLAVAGGPILMAVLWIVDPRNPDRDSNRKPSKNID